MDRVGFEPTTSAMPMPYPTRLDDRPLDRVIPNILHINICYMYDKDFLSPYEVKVERCVSDDIFLFLAHGFTGNWYSLIPWGRVAMYFAGFYDCCADIQKLQDLSICPHHFFRGVFPPKTILWAIDFFSQAFGCSKDKEGTCHFFVCFLSQAHAKKADIFSDTKASVFFINPYLAHQQSGKNKTF